MAVSIIGIISAIAYPAFDDYRQSAARTASDVSASNIIRALKNCLVLKEFNSCDSLSDLKINCPGDANCDSNSNTGNFCAHIKKGKTGRF